MSRMLDIQGVRRCFGGLQALAGVSLQFHFGTLNAVVGPNGSGKTTLLDVVSGFLRPDAGNVRLCSDSLTGCHAHEVARLGVARTFQSPKLVNLLSVRENIMLARQCHFVETPWRALGRRRLKEYEAANETCASGLLAWVGLGHKAEIYAGHLSFGERKMLSLCCAMATGARLILLDEPIAGVSPTVRDHVLRVISSLRSADRVVVFVEHDLAAVEAIADRVVLLDRGLIALESDAKDKSWRTSLLER